MPSSGRDERFPVMLDMLLDLTRECSFGKPQLIRLLEVHPEFSCGVGKGRQPHRRIARDAALPLIIAVIRFAGTSRALASIFALIGEPEGFMNSSSRIAPG